MLRRTLRIRQPSSGIHHTLLADEPLLRPGFHHLSTAMVAGRLALKRHILLTGFGDDVHRGRRRGRGHEISRKRRSCHWLSWNHHVACGLFAPRMDILPPASHLSVSSLCGTSNSFRTRGSKQSITMPGMRQPEFAIKSQLPALLRESAFSIVLRLSM